MRAHALMNFGLPAAAIASMAVLPPAHALDVDRVLGRWSGMEYDDCGHADDSEGAPLKIWREGDETLIGNYGWLCAVKQWSRDGGLLVGSAKDCGSEGDDDTFDQDFRIGLNDKDQLVLIEGAMTGTLRRCPAAQ